jgi:nucleotide-binding universal stress UspA family protein
VAQTNGELIEVAHKTLVVPLDGSAYAERALPIAKRLSEQMGAGLVLVSAQYYGPLEPSEYLEEKAALVGEPVEIVATKATYAAEVIVETVDSGDDRIVCMTTHGRGRFRWAALGSVAEEVIRRSDRPVLLVGRNCRADFLERSSRLLACCDGSEESGGLAPAARAWADLLDLELRIAVVTHPLDVGSAEHCDALLQSVVAQFEGVKPAAATMIRSRFVAGAIADYADELPAALVGLNCHGRTGLARFALGSVTMGVLHLAPCPLLVTHRVHDAGKES